MTGGYTNEIATLEKRINRESATEWLLCPICNSKTRIKLRPDTKLINFPLLCPKCKNEVLINVRQLNISVIKEPDA
ncbi:MAG: cysteine-rich KTR domain-containing protein [Clostridiales bacterium]|nr:cysteine-rich KTR domain-containing protein [Clostridiales bacterium]